MNKVLQFSIILSAVDKLSKTVQGAADNAVKTLRRVKKEADDIAKSAFSFGRDALGVGVAMGAPLVYATKKAVEFEDKMADVAKVMNLKVGSAEFKAMGDQAQKAAVYLSVSANEAAGLMASLAQGGVVKEELNDVVKIAGEMGVAFGMGAEIAGERFVKMKNALGSTTAETKRVADAINYLSDNSAAKATDILDFMAAGGAGVANTLKLGGQNAAAFGATLVSMGKSGAESATIMERFQKGVLTNVDMRKVFERAGGGAAGLLAVLKKGERLSGAARFEYFQKFGEYGTSIMQMAQNSKLLSQTIGLVADETKYANSVTGEFENRNSTTAGKLKKLQAQVEVLAIGMGETFLPVLLKITDAVRPIIEGITSWAERNPRLAEGLMFATAALAAFSIAVAAGSFIVGGIAKATSVWAAIMTATANGTKILTAAQWLLNAAMAANPVTWIAIGVAALVAGIVIAYNKFEAFRGVIWGTWEAMKAFGDVLKTYVLDRISGILSGLSGMGKALKLLFDGEFGAAYDAGKQSLKDLSGASALQNAVQNTKGVGAAFKTGYNNGAASLAAPSATPTPSPTPVPVAGSQGASVNYAPVINFNGGAVGAGQRDEFVSLLKKHEMEVARVVNTANERTSRKSY